MKLYESIYNQKPLLNECVIVGGKFNKSNTILAKNRDRMYVPKIKIVHDAIDMVEMVYIQDEMTGWVEGMNFYSIGIINSSLMVDDDENELMNVKLTGQKSKDSPRMLKALTYTSIKDAVNSVANWDSGISGHNFVANKKRIYHIESTKRHKPYISEVPNGDFEVFTNHGFHYQDIGYQHGRKFLSSKLRKSTVENTIQGNEVATSILDKLNNQKKKFDFYNPVRDSFGMKTTSQMAMDLFELIFYFRPVEGNCEYLGIENKLEKKYPKYKPRIKIKVLDPISLNKS